MKNHTIQIVALSLGIGAGVVLANTAQATVISRYSDWSTATFTSDSNTMVSPNGDTWSYYWQTGAKTTTTPYVTSLLDPSNWTAVPWNGSNFQLSDPIAGPNAGVVRGYQESIQTYWNVYGASGQDPDFRPSWSIVTYTEGGDQAEVYNLGGLLQWQNKNSTPVYGVYIEIAKVSEGSVISLYKSGELKPPGNNQTGIWTVFDETDGDISNDFPSELKNIELNPGEQLAVGIRGANDQYRNIYLLDSGMTLTTVPEPASFGLLGLCGLLALRRSRQG